MNESLLMLLLDDMIVLSVVNQRCVDAYKGLANGQTRMELSAGFRFQVFTDSCYAGALAKKQ